MAKSFYVSLSAFAAIVLAVTANGADYTLTKGDESGKSSVTSWDVSGENIGAPTAENNYYTGAFVMRAVDKANNSVFKGKSLHIGPYSGYSTGALAIPGGGSKRFSVENDGLFLVQGRIVPYSANQQLALEGKVTVVNTKTNNFYIGSADKNHSNFTNNFSGILLGDKDAYLNYRAHSTGCFAYLRVGMTEYLGTLKIARMSADDYPWTVEYRNGYELGGTLVIGAGCYLYPQYGTSHATVGSLVLEDGAILGGRSGSGNYATVTVNDSISIGRNITFRYSGSISAGNAYDVPFLVKAAGATGELHPEHFVETSRTPEDHECLPRWWFETRKGDDGSETLYYRQNKVVQIKSTDSNVYGETFTHSSLVDESMIQNGALPQGDYDYVITKNGFAGTDGKSWQGTYLFTPTDLVNKSYEFKGKSLTIGTGCTFKSAANPLTIDTLRLTGNSWFFPRVNSGTATTLEGRELFIGPEMADADGNLQPAMIDVYGKCVWTCKAALTGPGHLKFRANQGSSNPGGAIVLQGLSTNFLGKITISSGSWDATKLTASVNECVKVSDARQLGGELAAFTADALKLENWGTLEATDDVDFSMANRGVTVGNYGQMRVASGKTLMIGNKVTLNGELHKAGTGTLAFGAAAEAGTGAKLVVDAGTVQANVATAFAGVDVSFANGTALIVDTTRGFGEKGVDLSGATTAVNVQLGFAADETEHELSAYPLCTVSAGVTVTVARPKRHFVKLTTKSNGDGTVTYLADVGVTGAAIILR